MSLIIPRNFKRAKAQDAAARDRRDSSGFLTVGTKVRFDRGGTGKIIKVKKIYSYGYVEPEYTLEDEKGNVFIENEGRFTAIDSVACDAAELHVGQRVRAKDPAYEYSDGKALGAGMFTVKEVNNNGDVKLDDYGDVWISPSALVEANDACGKGEDAEKFRVGQKVKHTRFGTIGKVFEIAPDGAIGVQWSNGQAYYGEFNRPLSEIVAVDE